jgi:hypothetical protein
VPPGVWGRSFFIPQDAERGSYPLQEQALCHAAHLAPELYCSADMKRNTRKRRATCLLRWVFQRDNRLLTCQLDQQGHRSSYSLSLVPHWDVTQAATETFAAGVSAFRRHAAIADQLRRQGWTLAAYSLAR